MSRHLREETPLHNLPVPLTPPIGRDRELAEIGCLLGDPACRLLTLLRLGVAARCCSVPGCKRPGGRDCRGVCPGLALSLHP